jgi:short-subunit dehydrogenase
MLLNVTTLTELTYFFIKDMVLSGKGTVINLASGASYIPIPYWAVYAASKAYVLSFTESLSYEYSDKGIRCLVVCPSATQTKFMDQYNDKKYTNRSPESVVKATFKALEKKRVICNVGIMARVLSFGSHILPRSMARKIAGHFGRTAYR